MTWKEEHANFIKRTMNGEISRKALSVLEMYVLVYCIDSAEDWAEFKDYASDLFKQERRLTHAGDQYDISEKIY